MDDFFDDAGVFSLLNFIGGAGVACGKIGSEMLEGGGIAKSKITSNAASMDRFFAVFDDTVKIIKPSDALIKIGKGELELI